MSRPGVFALGTLLGFAAIWVVSAGHAANPPGNIRDEYRAPWREGLQYLRDGGCPVRADTSVPGQEDCTFHAANTVYAWAIDLNSPGPGNDDCGDTLKADRAGGAAFYEPAEVGPSSRLGIVHSASRSSWYVHVDYQDDAIVFVNGDWRPWKGWYTQGDFAARTGNYGTTYCHLHYFVTNSTAGNSQSINVCLSGDCVSSGWSLQSLSDDAGTAHESNNTGPGYARPGAPAGLDPASTDGLPDSEAINDIVSYYGALGADVGSTFAAPSSACGANRRWIKGCNIGFGGFGYTQNFMAPGFPVYFPQSVVEAPDGAHIVKNAMWKAYGGRTCNGTYVYGILGKPVSNEEDGEQDFQFGSLVRNDSDPNAITVSVYDGNAALVCAIAGLVDYYAGECLDVTGDGSVTMWDVSEVVRRFGRQPGGAGYDDRYNLDRDAGGVIAAGDIARAAQGYRNDGACR